MNITDLKVIYSILLSPSPFSPSIRKSLYGAPADRKPVSMGTAVFYTD